MRPPITAVPGFNSVLSWRIIATTENIYSARIIVDVLVYEASDYGRARVQLRAVLVNYCNNKNIYSVISAQY
jgi:hypothetical protein